MSKWITEAEVVVADRNLMRLRHAYEDQQKPIDPADLRKIIHNQEETNAALLAMIKKICHAVYDIDNAKAEKHLGEAEIPF